MKNRLCLSAAFVALLGIGACAATSPSANAQSNSAPAIGRGGCYSPNLSLVNANWDSIAQTCGAQILQTRDIRDATYARYYTGRALVELGQRPENRAQAGRFFEEAMGHLQRAIEDEQILDANEKPFHAARLELARALSGLGRYDEALAKLAEIERDTTATRNPRLAMTGVRAKIARGAILESRAGPPEGPIETRDLRNAISAYEDAVRDAAQPLPQPDYSRMKRKERQAAEAVAKAFDAERNSLKVEAERLLLTSSQRLANTALARSGALVEPNPQERTNDRRSLGDASDALRSAIAVIDAARLQSSTGNAGNLSNADISATYVARGKVELLLAGYEGAASRPDFGCASGAGDPNRVDTALQSFNSALRDSGLSGAIAADAYAGRGCALQASSAMDAYARSAQLSDAETAFSQALNVDPSTSKTRRYLDLGRAQMALASHQKSINSSQYTATLDRAVKTFKDAILPNPQNRPNISRENAATLIATADAYADLGNDAQRHEALVRASQEDPNLARAIYEHGRMHYDAFSEARLAGRGPSTSSYPNETGLSDSSLALDLLSSAAAKGSSTGDVKTEALALYYASKVMIEGGLSRPNLDAVEMAGDALSKVNTWENRQQACLSRIWRGDGTGRVRLLTGSSPPAQLARNVCEAGEERPEAYLMRGLYHIRLSHYGGAENQLDNLEGAQLAFRTGTQMLSELPTSGAENVERIERLRAEFEVAQARVERCLNQERLSDQRLLDMDQVRRVKAEKYFATYNVNQCNR